jgi:DNA-binding winged helix-turn-helix (wHTH) protein/tetratricopeptide (TPR) repeat protein/TolB-like protein
MAVGRTEIGSGRRDVDDLREASDPEGRLAFGPFVLDIASSQLREGAREIPLAPKPFETLRFLVSHPGRLIRKSELLDELWHDTHVTEDVLVQCVVEIRRALGDDARHPTYIQTISRRGYRFLETVRPIEATPAAGAPALAPAPETGGEASPEQPPATARRGWMGFAAGAGVAGLAWLALSSDSPLRSSWGDAGAHATPGSLVVTPIAVQGPDESDAWLGEGLAEMIRSGLGQRPGIQLVPRHSLETALQAVGFGPDADPGAAARIAEQVRAERLVTGSFVRLENRFVVTLQLVHVPSGQTEGQVTARGLYPDDLMGSIDELCVEVFDRWDAAAVPRPELAFRPVRMATRSLDAFRHYSEALVWFARGGRRGAREAERRLDEAIRIDPGFAYAFLKKAEIQHWLGRTGYGQANPAPAIAAAAALADDLPEREQLLVRLLDAALVQKESAETIRQYEELESRYTGFAEQVGVTSLVGDLCVREGRWDRLIELGLAHVESPAAPRGERALLASYLGRAFRQKGEFERALYYADRALRLWPTPDGPAFLLRRAERGRVLLAAGERERALADFAAVASDPETDAASLTSAAWGFYQSGDRERATALTERAVAMDPGFGNAHHLRGWLAMARGEYAAAAESMQRAFETTRETRSGEMFHGYVMPASGDLAALYYAGVALDALGRRGEARRRFETLRELCMTRVPGGGSEGLLAWTPAYLSAIAAARLGEPVPDLPRLEGDDASYFLLTARLRAVEGNREDALRLLGRALPLVPDDRQHIRDDPNFEALREDPEFRAMVGG